MPFAPSIVVADSDLQDAPLRQLGMPTTASLQTDVNDTLLHPSQNINPLSPLAGGWGPLFPSPSPPDSPQLHRQDWQDVVSGLHVHRQFFGWHVLSGLRCD